MDLLTLQSKAYFLEWQRKTKKIPIFLRNYQKVIIFALSLRQSAQCVMTMKS